MEDLCWSSEGDTCCTGSESDLPLIKMALLGAKGVGFGVSNSSLPWRHCAAVFLSEVLLCWWAGGRLEDDGGGVGHHPTSGPWGGELLITAVQEAFSEK